MATLSPASPDASLVDHALPPADGEERRGLFYPMGRWVPEAGKLHEVAPGVFWLRMPLPFSLDHINLWVLDDGDGWALVDTGLNAANCKAVWTDLLAGPLALRPVTRVIVTHYHPDHLGMAGWLTYKTGAPLVMARTEYLMARMLTLDIADAPPSQAVEFFARAGWPEDALARFRAKGWGRFSLAVTRLPPSYLRIADGDTLRIGGRAWHIVTGRGHTPEHACLVSEDDGLMIAGDQVLPRITSNVSVYSTEPEADPLGDWLESIEKLRRLDAKLYVLPAHNEPFTGIQARLNQLEADHHRKLDALEAFLAEPRSARQCFEVLFGRQIGEDEMMMATGEALAHLHYLERRGRATRTPAGGVQTFRAV
jgi:glyoxylase-like metal-dependent hydrolase (beta-lactamase superfamily II)